MENRTIKLKRCNRFRMEAFLLLALLVLFELVDIRAPLSLEWHKIVEVGIVLLGYGLVWAFLCFREAAKLLLLKEDPKD